MSDESRESNIEIGSKLRSQIPKIEKARAAEVMTRSVVDDRLRVKLPDDLHGEWVLNNDVEVARKQSMGFVIDTEFATANSLHNDGTGKATIGDVIHMITTKENMAVYHSIAAEMYRKNHVRETKEEKDFRNEHASAGSPILVEGNKKLPESRMEVVDAAKIVESLPTK